MRYLHLKCMGFSLLFFPTLCHGKAGPQARCPGPAGFLGHGPLRIHWDSNPTSSFSFLEKIQPTSLHPPDTVHGTTTFCLPSAPLPVQTSLCLFISVISTNRDLVLWPEIFPQFHIWCHYNHRTYLKHYASFDVGLLCDHGPRLKTLKRAFGKDA